MDIKSHIQALVLEVQNLRSYGSRLRQSLQQMESKQAESLAKLNRKREDLLDSAGIRSEWEDIQKQKSVLRSERDAEEKAVKTHLDLVDKVEEYLLVRVREIQAAMQEAPEPASEEE